MVKRTAAALLIATSAVAVALPATAPAGAATKPHRFANCAALNKVFPHGVGTTTARDRVTSGRPVPTFTRSNAWYAANKASDRDKDGVACERR